MINFEKSKGEYQLYNFLLSCRILGRYVEYWLIREIQNIYRLLYQKNFNNSQAMEKIEAEMEATSERDEILLFIRNSQRGIMKGYWGG